MLTARGIAALGAAAATILAASTISPDPANAYLPDFESRMTETGILQTAYFFPEPGVGFNSAPVDDGWYIPQGRSNLPVYWNVKAAADPGPTVRCHPSVVLDGQQMYSGPDLTSQPFNMMYGWEIFNGMHGPGAGVPGLMTLDGAAFAGFVAQPRQGTGTVSLDCGTAGTASWTGPVRVMAASPPGRDVGVSINDGADSTNSPRVTLNLGWSDADLVTQVKVSNDGGFAPSKTEVFDLDGQPIPWTLVQLANERIPRMVYVRFGSAGTWQRESYSDDIVLDTVKPEITSASLTGSAGFQRAAARAGRRVLRVTAKDNRTGVASMQVSLGKASRKAPIRDYERATAVRGRGVAYVRVRDGAGNWSPWRTAS